MKNIDQKSIAIIVLIIAVIVQFLVNNKRVDRLEAQLALERVKANFASIPYDSVHAKNDSVSFFSNDSLVGQTVTATIE